MVCQLIATVLELIHVRESPIRSASLLALSAEQGEIALGTHVAIDSTCRNTPTGATNIALGHQVDAREWSDAVEILAELGIKSVVLMTNNPEKIQALSDAGIESTVHSLPIAANEFNKKYLDTKATKLGHIRSGE